MLNLVGQTIGPCKLTNMLGSGGFAEVYLGEHVRLKKQVAIKILKQEYREDRYIQRFHLEAQLMSGLKHRHIMPVLDSDTENGIPFLVMEYAPHGTLHYTSDLSLSKVADYVNQVAEALQYIHSRSIIHRDIKPENMLRGSQNEILLSDFGIATPTPTNNDAPTLARRVTRQPFVGTVSYMAPEHLAGDACRASDQYSLGIVIYEWLCGARPFQGNVDEVIIQQISASPPPLRQRRSDIPPAIEEVVLRALKKKPEARYPSIADFNEAFQEAFRETLPPSPPLPVSGEIEKVVDEAVEKALAQRYPDAAAFNNAVQKALRDPSPGPTIPLKRLTISSAIASGVAILLTIFLISGLWGPGFLRPTNVSTNVTPVDCGSGQLLTGTSSAFTNGMNALAQLYHTRCPGAFVGMQTYPSADVLAKVEDGKLLQLGASDIPAGPDKHDLVAIPVAAVPYTIVVSPDIAPAISTLSLKNIQDIYSGNVTNWKELGGPNTRIYAVSRVSTSGTRQVFEQYVLGGCEGLPSGSKHEVNETDEVISLIKNTPGAIGYVDVGSAVNSALPMVFIDGNQPTLSNIQNKIYQFWTIERFYTRGAATELAKAFSDYVTIQGDSEVTRLLQKNGYYNYGILSDTTLASHPWTIDVSKC